MGLSDSSNHLGPCERVAFREATNKSSVQMLSTARGEGRSQAALADAGSPSAISDQRVRRRGVPRVPSRPSASVRILARLIAAVRIEQETLMSLVAARCFLVT